MKSNNNLISPVIDFTDYTEFEYFLKDLCNTDKWEIMQIGEVKMNYTKGGEKEFEETSPELTDALNKEGTLFLSLVGNASYRLPVNDSALFTLKDRLGITCPLSTDLLDSNLYENFSLLFNFATRHYSDKQMKCLRRKGQIVACHSTNYAVIRQDEIFSVLDKNLKSRFPKCEMKTASYTTERTTVTYDLADSYDTIMEKYRDACERCDIAAPMIDESYATIAVATGDTGESTVEIEPILSIDGAKYPLGQKSKVKHHGKGNVRTVEHCIDLTYSRIGDGINTVAEMIETPVYYPVNALINAAKEVGIYKNAKKALKTVVDDYSASIGSVKQNAFDVYQNLLEIRYTDQYSKLTSATKLKIEESFYRLLKLNWADMDIPGSTVL